MNNVYLFQPQYTNKFNGKLACWLPYSVGCLWSYVAQFDDIKNNYQLSDIIFKRELHTDILNRMHNPSVCAFSCYVWNYQYQLALAKKIKEKWPKITDKELKKRKRVIALAAIKYFILN